jgi:hypothetical protein
MYFIGSPFEWDRLPTLSPSRRTAGAAIDTDWRLSRDLLIFDRYRATIDP